MPEQPHNSAEDALQRYARERRASSGDFALHPATRRMLQGEVARVYGARANERRGIANWFTAWRMAGASALLATFLGLGIWIFSDRSTPVGSRSDELATLSETESPAKLESEMRRESAVILRDSITREKVAATPATNFARKDGSQFSLGLDRDEVKKTEPARSLSTVQSSTPITNAFYYAGNTTPQPRGETSASYGTTFNVGNEALAANGQQQLAMTQNSVLRNTTGGQAANRYFRAVESNSDARAVQQDNFQTSANLANNSVANSVDASSQATLGRDSQTYGTTGELAANAPMPQSGAKAVMDNAGQQSAAATAPQAPGIVADTAPALAGTAMRARRTEDRVLREQLAAPAETEVLTRFNFEQQGNSVRLVDADGSVYTGRFVDEQTDQLEVAPATKEAFSSFGKAVSSPAGGRRNFRAAGTNVSLNQLVVVNGRVAPSTQQVTTFIASPGDAEKAKRDIAAQTSQVIPPAPAVPTTAPISRSAGIGGAMTNSAPALEGTVRVGGAQRGLRASPAQQ